MSDPKASVDGSKGKGQKTKPVGGKGGGASADGKAESMTSSKEAKELKKKQKAERRVILIVT